MRTHRRIAYVGLAACTIALGLAVHRGAGPLTPAARDVLGDALWAAMIVWWSGVVAPGARWWVRAAAAFAVCACVETSQLLHTPTLDALRGTVVGRLVLGSGFDPRDFAAYALGVLAAALLDRAALARWPSAHRTRVTRLPARGGGDA